MKRGCTLKEKLIHGHFFKMSSIVPKAAGTGLGRMGINILCLFLEEGWTTAVGLEADWRMLAMPETDIEVRLRMGLSGETVETEEVLEQQ